MEELILIKEAIASTALAKGWDKETQDKMFHEVVAQLIKDKTPKRKNHRKNGL